MCSSCDWQGFAKECEDTLRDIEEIPERGESFAEGVREKVESMRDWATENKHTTERMRNALSNIQNGVAKWLGN